jgi:hypothetical protein
MVTKVMMNTKMIVTVLLVSIFLAACAPAPTPTPSPSPTPCPYSRNPGPPPPEVEKRAQAAFFAMGASGIRGTLKIEANGEYSCDKFAVEDINFQYTLYVSNLGDQASMQEYASRVRASAKESAQGWNMGVVRVRFVAGKECWWDEVQQNACAPISEMSSPP